MVPAEEAFVLTVGVPHNNKDAHCRRALKVLAQAGYHAAQTSDESILALASQVEGVRALKGNDPE